MVKTVSWPNFVELSSSRTPLSVTIIITTTTNCHYQLSLSSSQQPPTVTIIITATNICHHHQHNNQHLSPSSTQQPTSVTIIIKTTTICHYHHIHHHLSLSSSKPPTSVTIITTTTNICHHHHNHHHLSLSSQPPPSVTIISNSSHLSRDIFEELLIIPAPLLDSSKEHFQKCDSLYAKRTRQAWRFSVECKEHMQQLPESKMHLF